MRQRVLTPSVTTVSRVARATCVLLVLLPFSPAACGQIITTVAGNGAAAFGGDGGPATAAQLFQPSDVTVDTSGKLFVADTFNNRIRLVNAGTITTVAGNGTGAFSGDGGPATAASLSIPTSVALDSSGNLFIADQNNQRVRRVNLSTGVITTVAGSGNGTAAFGGDGGPATAASLAFPTGVAVDSSGNLFIADQVNQRIRRVNAGTGTITTVAGNGTAGFSGDGGPATAASLNDPSYVALDSAGNLFIADGSNQRIRRVDRSTGIITTVAGNGTPAFSGDGGLATAASLRGPGSVAIDSAGNLFIGDYLNNRVRRVIASTGNISTVAGNGTAGFAGDGGLPTAASLNGPNGIAIDSSGALFFADFNNSRIRRVVLGPPVSPYLRLCRR